MVQIISWNVNGIRSINTKGKDGKKHTDNVSESVLQSIIATHNPDIICLQEIKCSLSNEKDFDMYRSDYKHIYMNCSSARKGYSGVAVLTKKPPLNVSYGFEKLTTAYTFDQEGRMLTLEYENMFVICCYTPNSKPKLERLDERTNVWEPAFRKYVMLLQSTKPVVIVGDLNVAPTENDIHTTKGHARSAGFTKEERGAFAELVKECDLVDAFRKLHPNERRYTYFSNFAKSRERNAGWRIDFTLVSKKLGNKVEKSEMLSDYYGSDHVPILLTMK